MMKNVIRLIAKCMPVLAIVLIAGVIVVTNELAGQSGTVGEIEKAIDTVKTENELLEAQVAAASSLASISTKAEALGFVKATSYVTLPASIPVALGQ